MDIATVLGVSAGVFFVVWSIWLGGNFSVFIDYSSMILVLGGTISVTLMNFPLRDVLSVFNTVKNTFVHKMAPPEQLINLMVELSTVARREGILALENRTAGVEEPFLKQSIQLAIDGTPPELIRDILSTEVAFMEDRHAMGQSMLQAIATFAPAFGMIGTLVGLVQMLATLDDPSKIGSGMSVAILTTLYGALIANLFCLPLLGKLKVRTAAELLRKEIIIEGILSIQSGDNPRVIEQKLKAFIAPNDRVKVGVEL